MRSPSHQSSPLRFAQAPCAGDAARGHGNSRPREFRVLPARGSPPAEPYRDVHAADTHESQQRAPRVRIGDRGEDGKPLVPVADPGIDESSTRPLCATGKIVAWSGCAAPVPRCGRRGGCDPCLAYGSRPKRKRRQFSPRGEEETFRCGVRLVNMAESDVAHIKTKETRS